MLASGADVSIGGVEYSLALDQQPHYVHRYESLFANATAISGEIAKQQLRPEKLLWSLTDFSGGEGSPIYYPQDSTGYDIGSGVNVTNAGLLTTRPRRRVTSVARSGSTATTGMRPAGGSTWDKAIIMWGSNGLFSRDAIGWTAGTGSTSYSGANLFGNATDGRYMIAGEALEATVDVLVSIDGSPATPTYADIFSGTTILNAPYVVAISDGVWYAWGIDAVASSALALVKGAALSGASTGTLIFNSGLIPSGTWGSSYWTDMVSAEGSLFMSFATPAGSRVYTSEADVGREFYVSEPGFVIQKLVYKLGVLFCIGAQISAGKKFASVIAIPLQTASPINIGSPRRHRNTELSAWEVGCAGPGNTLFLGESLTGKIFTYDMKRDSFSLFDDLANAGTGDGLSFTSDGNVLPYATSTMEASTLALTGWTQSVATVTLSTVAPRSGLNHLSLSSAGVALSATGTAGIPIEANISYTARAYIRGSTAAGTGVVSILWYTSAGAVISTSTGSGLTLTTSYAAATCVAVSPTNAAYAAISISDAGAAAGYVDDVTLAPTSSAGTDRLAFLAMHGSRLFGATYQPTGTGTSLQVISWDDGVKENRDASQAISGTLESGEWDYGLPQEQKALIGFYVTYEVTDPATDSGLLANSRITISYATDEGISVTPTYTALDVITSTTIVTAKGRHFLPVSDADSTKKFSRLKIKITLDNNSTAVAPPIVYSVVAESQLMAYAETWDLAVRVQDEDANQNHPRSRQVDASVLRDNLLNLAVNKEIVEFQDGARYGPRPNAAFTTHTVMVEDPTDVIDHGGEGYMQIKLRSVPS
jgi:hypothetical protein